MRWINRLTLRLRSLFKRTHVECELDAELRFHLEQQIEGNVATGMDPDEARLAALRSLGSSAYVKDECRDSLGLRLVDELRHDLRCAMRTLVQNPGFTIFVVLTLALGIGANTTIFSLIDSLILRTLPVKDSSRLVLVTSTLPGVSAWNYPIWDEVRQRQLFEDSAAWSLSRFNLASGGETQFVDGLWASGSFFETLGVQAMIGRTFNNKDDQLAGGPDGPVAVISYSFWQRHFGGAADIIGRTLPLDGVPFTIIGVTQLAFAKLKAFLRAARPRTFEHVCELIAAALGLFMPDECANYVRHCGYRLAM